MPFDIFFHFFVFVTQLLRLVFSKSANSFRLGLFDHRHRFCFADGDQLYLTAVSSASLTSFTDTSLYFLQIFFYHVSYTSTIFFSVNRIITADRRKPYPHPVQYDRTVPVQTYRHLPQYSIPRSLRSQSLHGKQHNLC